MECNALNAVSRMLAQPEIPDNLLPRAAALISQLIALQGLQTVIAGVLLKPIDPSAPGPLSGRAGAGNGIFKRYVFGPTGKDAPAQI